AGRPSAPHRSRREHTTGSQYPSSVPGSRSPVRRSAHHTQTTPKGRVMKNVTRIKESTRARLAASAVAVAALVAAAAGIVPGQGNAAPARGADKASHHFKHPKLRHGLLTIR